MSDTSRTALVIDDDDIIRETVAAFLEGEGWKCFLGCDGDEAISMTNNRMPDLIVMDVMMPGKDGFEALKELREDHRFAHIPVVMLTAVNEFELGERHDADSVGADLGVDPPEAFIDKPVKKDDLLAAINEIMAA